MMDFTLHTASHYIRCFACYSLLLSRTGNKILGLIVPVGVIASLVYMYRRYYTYENDWRYYYRYCGSIILGRGVAESTKG